MYEELLKKYGYIEHKVGTNDNGETVVVSIDKECACIRTLQNNKWSRINIYHKDGTVEELYEA